MCVWQDVKIQLLTKETRIHSSFQNGAVFVGPLDIKKLQLRSYVVIWIAFTRIKIPPSRQFVTSWPTASAVRVLLRHFYIWHAAVKRWGQPWRQLSACAEMALPGNVLNETLRLKRCGRLITDSFTVRHRFKCCTCCLWRCMWQPKATQPLHLDCKYTQALKYSNV